MEQSCPDSALVPAKPDCANGSSRSNASGTLVKPGTSRSSVQPGDYGQSLNLPGLISLQEGVVILENHAAIGIAVRT
jgi:hypothetical protein